MAAYPITRMHQDGTAEASVDFGSVIEDDGSVRQVPMPAWSIRIAREGGVNGAGWALLTKDGAIIYGPVNGRYFARRGAELRDLDVSNDPRFRRR